MEVVVGGAPDRFSVTKIISGGSPGRQVESFSKEKVNLTS